MFSGSNLSHEEDLTEWLAKYRPQIEMVTSHIKRGSMRGLSSAGITAAMIVAAINDVPEAYIAKFLEVFYSGFTTNEAEHYAVMLRDDLIRNNTSKTGTQYAKYAFYRTANRRLPPASVSQSASMTVISRTTSTTPRDVS